MIGVKKGGRLLYRRPQLIYKIDNWFSGVDQKFDQKINKQK